MQKQSFTSPMNVRFPAEHKAWLHAEAARRYIGPSAIVREAVAEYIRRQEAVAVEEHRADAVPA